MRAWLWLLLLVPGVSWADTHAVTVRNGGSEVVRGVQIGPAGRLGENRMRSQLPPGAEARITYSTGCQADMRLTYASGRTEDHSGLDVCADPRVVAGQSGVAGPAGEPVGAAVSAGVPAMAVSGRPGVSAVSATAVGGSKPGGPTPLQVSKTPAPPWSGRSITRRFGGMD